MFNREQYDWIEWWWWWGDEDDDGIVITLLCGSNRDLGISTPFVSPNGFGYTMSRLSWWEENSHWGKWFSTCCHLPNLWLYLFSFPVPSINPAHPLTFGNDCQSMTYSFVHSGYFYSASSSPLLLRGNPDTARILCRIFTPKCVCV